ncbi:MAG: AsnC family transcriptional regulator [Candidatus Hodarchaeales archaeon]
MQESDEIQRAKQQLERLQKAKITDFPSLYEQLVVDSPIVKNSLGLFRPLLDLLVDITLTGGFEEFEEGLNEAGELTLEEFVRLCELCIHPSKLDKRDAKIVQILFHDPLRTHTAIAKELKLHRSTVARRILRLSWTDSIRSYPLPDWHYFGITKLGFRYKCLEIPKIDEKRCYSRLALFETDSGPKILDNWNCPFDQEDILRNEYLSLEREGQISDLEIRQHLGVDKIIAVSHFLEKATSIPQIGLEMKRRLEGRKNEQISKKLNILRQKIEFFHPPDFDNFDILLLQELWPDFLLRRTRAEVAQLLGVSIPTISRRTQNWISKKMVMPSLQFGYKGNIMRQGPTIMDVGLRVDIRKKNQVCDFLAMFPRTFIYELKINGRRILDCYTSLFPETRGLFLQLPSDLGLGTTFRFEYLAQPSAAELFATYDFQQHSWQKLGRIFK